jgi:hypothetical protein
MVVTLHQSRHLIISINSFAFDLKMQGKTACYMKKMEMIQAKSNR